MQKKHVLVVGVIFSYPPFVEWDIQLFKPLSDHVRRCHCFTSCILQFLGTQSLKDLNASVVNHSIKVICGFIQTGEKAGHFHIKNDGFNLNKP